MLKGKADVEEACPTCGQRPRKVERPRSDVDLGMDVWAARDAYNAMPWMVLVLLGFAWFLIACVVEVVRGWLG